MVAGGAGCDVRAARLISLAFSSPLRFPGLFALLPFFFFFFLIETRSVNTFQHRFLSFFCLFVCSKFIFLFFQLEAKYLTEPLSCSRAAGPSRRGSRTTSLRAPRFPRSHGSPAQVLREPLRHRESHRGADQRRRCPRWLWGPGETRKGGREAEARKGKGSGEGGGSPRGMV